MRFFAISFTAAATLAIVVTLFHLKQRVGDLERELQQVNRAIAGHREAIRVLRTEWSYLNQPAAIEKLAKRHLGMRPNTPAQLIRLEDLPLRTTAWPVPAATALVTPPRRKEERAQ